MTAAPPPTGPVAGWYADPSGRSAYRYWDGRGWTEHTVDDLSALAPAQPNPYAAPAAPPESPPVPPVAPTPPSYPATPPVPAYATAPMPPQYTPRVAPAVPDLGVPADGPHAAAPLASIGARFLGLILDQFAVLFVTMVCTTIVAILGVAAGAEFMQPDAMDRLQAAIDSQTTPSMHALWDLFGTGGKAVFLTLIAVQYVASFINGVVLLSRKGQTLGDMAVGLRKTTYGGHVPGFDKATIRWVVPNLCTVLSSLPPVALLFSLLGMVDYLAALGDRGRRTLHDRIARTVVRRVR